MGVVRNVVLGGAVFLALVVDASQAGQVLVQEWWRREFAWTQVRAQVVGIKPDHGQVNLFYEYSLGATKYPGQLKVEKGAKRDGQPLDQIGAQIPVLYNPTDPMRHQVGLAEGNEMFMFRCLAAAVAAPNLAALFLFLLWLLQLRRSKPTEAEDAIGWKA